jgi:hypothetical protein
MINERFDTPENLSTETTSNIDVGRMIDKWVSIEQRSLNAEAKLLQLRQMHHEIASKLYMRRTSGTTRVS